MTEDRSKEDGSQVDPPSQDTESSTSPSQPVAQVANLLPKGFAPPKQDNLDPVEIARTNQDPKQRQKLRQRQKDRERARAAEHARTVRLTRLDQLAPIFVILTVVAAPVLLGSVHVVTVLPLALFSMIAMTCALIAVQLRKRSFRAGFLGWVLILMTGVTFLQAIPMPLWLVELLSPAMAQWLHYAYGALETTPTTATLGLNPGEASRAGFGLLAATGVYLASYNIFQRQERFQSILLTLPFMGLVLVLIGVFQKLMGISDRLFFYEPRQAEAIPFFASTFVNPNHLAALLGLISFIPLGLSLNKDYQHQRPGLVILFVLCSAGMVMTLSFTAVVAWLLGIATFGLLILRRRLSGGRYLSWVSLAALVALGMGLYAAWAQYAERVAFLARHQGISWFMPTEVWANGWDLLMRTPFTGVGRGGFADAFATILQSDTPARYIYVSNSYLQALIDYGIPLGSLLIIAIGYAVFRLGIRHRWKETDLPLMTAIFSGFVFLAFELFVSFSTEIPGVFIPALFLLGVANGRDSRYRDVFFPSPPDEPRRRRPSPPLKRIAPYLAMIAVCILSLFAFSVGMDTARGTPMHKMRETIHNPRTTAEAIKDTYREGLRVRPANSKLHLYASIGFQNRERSDLARAARERALFFQPNNPAPLLEEARALLRDNKRDKALEHYRRALNLATETHGVGRDALAIEIALKFPNHKDIVHAMPNAPVVWEPFLQTFLKRERYELVIAVANGLAQKYPEKKHLSLLWAARAYTRTGKWERARTIAQAQLDASAPQKGKKAPAMAYEILIQAAVEHGEHQEAFRIAEEALRVYPHDTGVLFTTAELLLHSKNELGFEQREPEWRKRIQRILTTLKPYASRNVQQRQRYSFLGGRYYHTIGRLPSAISHLRRTIELDPSNEEAVLLLAQNLHKDRQYKELAKTYQLFLERFPNAPQTPEIQVQLQELREQQRLLENFRSR